MKKIGLLSDTHGWWDVKFAIHFDSCDEIWHAGDIGSVAVAEQLAALKPLRAVHGNIDGQEIRQMYPRINYFLVERVMVMMTHIGGYPGLYEQDIRTKLNTFKPKLFIAGHTHIVKIMYDNKFNFLYVNPGAAGHSGFHQTRTLVRFVIDLDEIKDMEIIELGTKG